MSHKKTIYLLVWMALACASPLRAQWLSHESVLSKNTWVKIGVTEDGIYAIDNAMLQAAGLETSRLNPDRIRMFGNDTGILPESNERERYDDLTEIPIQVTSAADGSLQVLFYGKGPTKMVMNIQEFYNYEPNPYTDTTFYFLCLDGDISGQRIQDNQPVSTTSSSPIINTFPDYLYHESEELSPYASGRTWYGDLFTGQDGFKEFVFDVPDFDNSKVCRIDSKVLGRCNTAFAYNLTVNGTLIVNQYTIAKYGDYDFGKEHSIVRNVFVDSAPFVIRYEIPQTTTSNPMLFNDYLVLNFWRMLRFHGGEMAFRIVPSQVTEPSTKVQLTGVGVQTVCWDVTNPLCPSRQPMDYDSGDASFGIDVAIERYFHLFEPAGVKQVASLYRIPNQNLHAITDANMLIITPRVFWDQSEALATFHRVNDGMNCLVVDVQEIYNEFATGAMDPTAVRDFIRMVYLRSQGNLKYVLFMGKGSHDYRDIKGMHRNFVPTYEIASYPFDEVSSMCSDDYFALMDQEEGQNCDGMVDLGLGRIPITTPEQGDAVVAKIMHYADLSATHGIWKNNHLLMADNDTRTYATHTDTFDYMLDTSNCVAMTKKLYIDSYPIINTAVGKRIPEANAQLMDYFTKGVSVLSYTGHGGVKSLSDEWVLGISDILALDNYDHLPFIHTATCEFSKFDNPNVVSGGELLLLNAHGGAIALLTTMRPTLAPKNFELSKSFHDHLYDKLDQQTMRFGDIYRLVKSDSRYYKKDNMVYVLFGDPALRFSYPSQGIMTTQAEVNAGLGTIEGFVTSIGTTIDTEFNGVIEVKVYDVKSNYTTLGNFGTQYNYSFYNDVIFEGKASVVKGHFKVQFPVPADVNQGSGAGRVSYYAYDSIRKVDANGVLGGLIVNKPLDVVDNKGPEINLYWNTPDFENGDVVRRSGVFYADLYDEHGIYHYDVSFGRDIILRSNVDGYENQILNDWYEPAVDDYQRGRITIPMSNLENGTYEFSLKAWDTQNNSSEVEMTFTVRQGAIIAQVRNFPNPFDSETWFVFDHGDMTDRLSVNIDVYDVLGRQVTSIQKETNAESGMVNPIRWDGSCLPPGLYVYRIKVTDSKGKSSSMCQRMVKQ